MGLRPRDQYKFNNPTFKIRNFLASSGFSGPVDSGSAGELLLHRNVQRLPGGLVFQVQKLLNHSTLPVVDLGIARRARGSILAIQAISHDVHRKDSRYKIRGLNPKSAKGLQRTADI